MGKKECDNPWNGVRSTVSRWTSRHPPNPTRSGNRTLPATPTNDRKRTPPMVNRVLLSGTGRRSNHRSFQKGGFLYLLDQFIKQLSELDPNAMNRFFW